MPRGSQYFDNLKHNFLIRQANENERIPNKIELEAKIIDEKIIQDQEFMWDDDFIFST